MKNETIAGTDIESARDGMLVRHPDRPVLKKRPYKAFRHFRALIADKEDTAQVFEIFDALPSGQFMDDLRSFCLSDEGEALRVREPFLPPMLDDRDTLRAMPEGSVAHAYCDFMEREGLSAAGLVAESARSWENDTRYDDLVRWYGDRRRDTHDLLHIITGYGRDALGEQCVLAFTHGQNGGFGNLFIAYLGGAEIKRTLPAGPAQKAPIMAALREAQVKGRGRARLCEMPIMDVLAMPLPEARALLGIADPAYYYRCHRVWRDAGYDPYDLLGQKAAA
ncbi:MAG: Coq4 family protein [Pontixanthobacter sp.]